MPKNSRRWPHIKICKKANPLQNSILHKNTCDHNQEIILLYSTRPTDNCSKFLFWLTKSTYLVSCKLSVNLLYKIEVIVPFIIDFLEGLYILHTVPVVDNVDSDDLWTGDVNPTLRKWRIWLVWEQKNLEMSKSMTNLSIHLVYHSSRDDLVLWDKSMFCWVLPKFIILSRNARGSISLLRGVALQSKRKYFRGGAG